MVGCTSIVDNLASDNSIMIHPEKEQPPDIGHQQASVKDYLPNGPEMGETAVQGYVYDGTLKTGVHHVAGPACWK